MMKGKGKVMLRNKGKKEWMQEGKRFSSVRET